MGVVARVGTPVASVLVLGAMVLTSCGVAPSASDAAERSGQGSSNSDGGSSGSDDRPREPGPSADPAEVPPDVAPELASFYEQELDWEECGRGGFECTTVEVPLDYDDPERDRIELAVVRLLALDQENRQGSLVLNPGGPGGSGVEYARAAPILMGEPLRRNYDIVGFDPRGVGESTPVECLPDEKRDEMQAADTTPESPAEVEDLVGVAEEFVAGCESRSGDLLGHVSTVDAARDMDILRGVLGDEALNYLGMSYGTFLGATFAEEFPERTGQFVLDAALDPSISGLERSLEQAKGFEVALEAFLEDCVREGCPLGDDIDEAYEALRQLLDDISSEPLPTGEDRELTEALAETGVIMPLYMRELWPRLRSALDAAVSGDGSELLTLADQYAERGPDGYQSNATEVIYAVNCLDRADVDSVAEIQEHEEEFAEASPMFGVSILWGSLPCVLWPEPPTGEPTELHASGTDPILVLGTTRDPATPYEWSVQLADQLDAGVLVTREGDGHTAYGTQNACIDSIVEEYFVEDTVPDDDTVCSP